MTHQLHHLQLREPLRDLHRCHQLVWQTTGTRCLWSQPLPDMLLVLHDGAIHPTRALRSVSTHPYRIDYKRGDRVGYSLIACPTRMDPATRRRHTLPPEQREDWLARKTAGALTIDALTIDHLGPRVASRHGATHVWVQYSGAARVADPDRLRHLLLTGIGPGKAHGAGLLIVGPQP